MTTMNSTRSHTYGQSFFHTVGDGRRLHYMVNGSGTPTVVFESGMGFSRSVWGLVQPLVAERARTVVYDRAGTGRSDPDTAPRTLRRITDDLDSLLRALGPGPFILVGHSWGGPIIRVAAATDPSRIRGIVLVDQSDEHCDMYFDPSGSKRQAMMRVLVPLLARIGIYRLLGSRAGCIQPADVAADHRNEDFTEQAARAMIAELAPFVDELAKLRDEPLDLGDLEVSLISGTKMSLLERSVRPAIAAAHRQAAAALANGRWVEAPKSGHLVMFSEPELIVNEINRMIG